MPNPIIPKTNANAGSSAAPNAADLAIAEIGSNSTTGRIYLRKRDGTIATFYPDGQGVSFAFRQSVFTGTGAQFVFSLPVSPAQSADVLVFLDGVQQVAGTDYNVSGAILTFTQAPPLGVSIVLLTAQGTNAATVQQAFAYSLIL